MPYYSKEQIAQAREMDLLTYLQNYEPTELVHVTGNTYSTREHDSLKISNGKWMWWSRGFGGASALDYLVKVRGDSFIDAVSKILGKAADGPSVFMSKERSGAKAEPKESPSGKLLLPERAPDNDKVISYLTGRGISREILQHCIDGGLIYESLPYHNCVFVGLDDRGDAKYAAYRAAAAEKIMGEAAGSDKRYSFRIDRAGSTLHVFESAIDLLSYATIMKMRTGEWRAEPMVSLGGVYAPSPNSKQSKLPIALENMTQNQSQINTIALHLDNDYAGRNAASAIATQLEEKYVIRDEPPAYGKDCNDYLQHMIRQKPSRQMGRE